MSFLPTVLEGNRKRGAGSISLLWEPNSSVWLCEISLLTPVSLAFPRGRFLVFTGPQPGCGALTDRGARVINMTHLSQAQPLGLTPAGSPAFGHFYW